MDSKTFNSKLAAALGDNQRHTAALTEAFAAILRDASKSLTAVAVPSFGSFVPVKSDEEIVVDRVSGKRLLLPPQITVEFHPAAMLRKKLISHE
ncbi:MAG: HU family DNA-binding protein [Muribaculaceae bacterium]|nr:HU family DNA-binding protein [Muribaculaceae bacterium]